jgi:hypothetical protein
VIKSFQFNTIHRHMYSDLMPLMAANPPSMPAGDAIWE